MSRTHLAPYINFQGRAREAMEHYHRILGGKLELFASDTNGQPKPAGPGDQIMYARLEADGILMIASDGRPGHPATAGDHISLSIGGPDRERLTTVFNALADGGRVVVAPGVYHERLNFHGRAVQVTSAQGPQVTILDGDHVGEVVSFVSGEGRGALLQGFTLRNGQVAAVAIGGSAPTVTGNVLDGTGTTLIGSVGLPTGRRAGAR